MGSTPKPPLHLMRGGEREKSRRRETREKRERDKRIKCIHWAESDRKRWKAMGKEIWREKTDTDILKRVWQTAYETLWRPDDVQTHPPDHLWYDWPQPSICHQISATLIWCEEKRNKSETSVAFCFSVQMSHLLIWQSHAFQVLSISVEEFQAPFSCYVVISIVYLSGWRGHLNILRFFFSLYSFILSLTSISSPDLRNGNSERCPV